MIRVTAVKSVKEHLLPCWVLGIYESRKEASFRSCVFALPLPMARSRVHQHCKKTGLDGWRNGRRKKRMGRVRHRQRWVYMAVNRPVSFSWIWGCCLVRMPLSAARRYVGGVDDGGTDASMTGWVWRHVLPSDRSRVSDVSLFGDGCFPRFTRWMAIHHG